MEVNLDNKFCAYCKAEFTPKSKSQKYCKSKHMKICEVCGVKFEVKRLNSPPRTCGQSCGSALSHTSKSREKRRLNSLEKHGTEHPFQAESVKTKIQESLDKSDNDMRFGSERFKETIVEMYGVDNVSKLESIKDKKVQSYQDRYGVNNPMQSKEVIKTREENMMNKYGFTNNKYIGVENLEDFMNLSKLLKKKEMDTSQLCKYFNVKRDKMQREIREQDVALLVKNYDTPISLKEDKFKEFIKERFPYINVIINDRKVLKGRELDFYFPDISLAVEISPSRTHNTKHGYNGSPGVSKDYHINKFLGCSSKGIELITIFDWHDWDKLLEMIASKLQGVNERVYARKTTYKEDTEITKASFELLSNWHILDLPSNFKRANDVSKLIYEGETIGIALWTKTSNDSKVELKRLVFKPGVSVIGGTSKLIKNYLSNHKHIKEVMTYSDCDLGQGNVYDTLGFELTEESRPQLNYYNVYYKKHVKHLSLVMQGADRLLANFPNYEHVGMGEGLPSNQEILDSYGFLQVYDCGYRKWRLNVK